jgi:hypothetical protein
MSAKGYENTINDTVYLHFLYFPNRISSVMFARFKSRLLPLLSKGLCHEIKAHTFCTCADGFYSVFGFLVDE